MSPELAARIAENVARVRQRIESAAIANGRRGSDIILVGVTKNVDVTTTLLLVQAGVTDIGESRPQSLWEKSPLIAAGTVRWHLIGSLQRNKVARTLPIVSLIHSVDSIRLAGTISRLSVESNRVQDVLLEVNISGETSKHGFGTASLPNDLPQLLEMPGIRLCGLMGMARFDGTESDTRNQFCSLRKLQSRLLCNMPGEHPLNELSMGMSGDFEWAIAEGATIVRIGTTLFEGIL